MFVEHYEDSRPILQVCVYLYVCKWDEKMDLKGAIIRLR